MIKAKFIDGVAAPESSVNVPDGSLVGIIVPETLGPIVEAPPELKEEFEFWQNLSADAWEKFLEWEREMAA